MKFIHEGQPPQKKTTNKHTHKKPTVLCCNHWYTSYSQMVTFLERTSAMRVRASKWSTYIQANYIRNL